jgi:hypothetical protein
VKSEKAQMMLFRAVCTGNDKKDLPIDRPVDASNCGQLILCVVANCAQYIPQLTQLQANKLIGTFLDDLTRACAGQISFFTQAPLTWWEIRQALSPVRSRNLTFTSDAVPASISYAANVSGVLVGLQSNIKTAVTSTAATCAPYTAISSTNADYEATYDLLANAQKQLVLCPDPFKGKANNDPSGFAYFPYVNPVTSMGTQVSSA